MERAKYQEVVHLFVKGEILKNNNGSDYRVVNAELQTEVVFERVSDGERVLAKYPKVFKKTENGNVATVLEWAWGNYLGKVKKRAESYGVSHINDFRDDSDYAVDVILFAIKGEGFDEDEYICCWVEGESWEDTTTYGVSARNDMTGTDWFDFSQEERDKIINVVKELLETENTFKKSEEVK